LRSVAGLLIFIEKIEKVELAPASEVMLDQASIERFRSGYRHLFGAAGSDDQLYAAVSEGRKHQGMEHWGPLFHDKMESLFDYLDGVPEHLYLEDAVWDEILAKRHSRHLSVLPMPTGPGVIDAGGRLGRDFVLERQQESVSLFGALADHVQTMRQSAQVIICSYSEGSITEQDILGDRLVRTARKRRRAENYLTEATSLSPGDLIVHLEHGVGRYQGLETITAAGAPHECIALEYADQARLFLPVENIELLSRYGHDDGLLDRLGGGAWQAKKAKLKEVCGRAFAPVFPIPKLKIS